MLFKRNLLENVTIISTCGALFCILLNYVTSISPISGIWFLAYILTLSTICLLKSIWYIQWLLRLNKPIKYDVDGWVKDYPWLWFLKGVLPQKREREKQECREYDTNELSVISTVLERKLVSSWYIPYISQEIGFPFACKQLLDQMINKTFQICHKIETKDVYVDMCAIIITHLKEYKKALKRHEKTPSSTVESLYKKSHSIFDPEKKISSADHCVNILRIILKELVPWELWDTPHSELLIRVLAKKLDNFIDNTLSEPAWLNDKLFMILETKDKETVKKTENQNVESEVAEEKTEVKKEDVDIETVAPPAPTVTSVESQPVPEVKPVTPVKIPKEEAQEVLEEVNLVEQTEVGTEPVEIKPTAVLRQKRGRQGKNEVKIYDRIIEGSVKTWETDMDLQCISVGQDLLASLDEMTLSRLWGHEDAEHSPNMRNRSPQPLWFAHPAAEEYESVPGAPKSKRHVEHHGILAGRSPASPLSAPSWIPDSEEDSIDIEHPEPVETKEVKKENSPKPTEALLKDLQSTVHQAKTKIGDLQVPLDIDVPCKHSSDEAAGMMEGLLDIGIAGLKKGLRFTGLSDDSQEKSPSHHRDKSEKSSSPDSARSTHKAASEPKEIPLSSHKEENGTSVPPLVKQHRVTSQDSVPSQPIPPRGDYASPLVPLSDSPEPEYEEVADLSTSIAKLRSLLQEVPNASRSEEIWWEGAEETRGRTQRAHHYGYSRPVDTATLADEYDMSGEPNSSPRQTSNNMQRLDKLFQRTVTGMFNSIKTAVSAEEELLLQPASDWTYILADSVDNSVVGAVGRLLGARRGVGRVDAALDPLHQPPPRPPPRTPPEDFEEWMAGAGAAWSGALDALSAAAPPARHVACRLAALLLADLGESLISAWLDDLSAWLRVQIFVVFERLAAGPEPDLPEDGLRDFRPEETCKMLLNQRPEICSIFGEEMVTDAARLVVASFSHKEINKDVTFRTLDLFAVHFKKSAGLRNPSFDNN